MGTPVSSAQAATARRARFSLRGTTRWLIAAAVGVCVLGIGAGLAGGAAERHPDTTLVVCLALLLTAAGGRRGHRSRRARREAAALTAGHPALADPAEADPLAADPLEEALAPVDYRAMAADEFEYAVAALCERDGCMDVRVVGGAGDLGADVVATAPDGRRIVIQCKHYCETNKVGSQDMQRFGGTCFTVHDAHVATVVTTSTFTDPAADYAEQCGILCVDHDWLTAWADGTGPAPWTACPDPEQDGDQAACG